MSYIRKDWISGQVIRQQALDNIENGLSQIYPLAKNAVRYNQAQLLSTAEKKQALQNLGIDDLKTRIDKIESDIPKTWSGTWRHANLVINQNTNLAEVQEDASAYSGCALCGPISPLVEGDVYETKNLNLVFRLLFVYDGENGEAIRYGNWTQKYTINLSGDGGVYNPSSVKRYYILVKNVNTVEGQYDSSILDLYLCQKYIVHRGSQQILSVESMVTNLQPSTFSSNQNYKAGDYVKNVNDNKIYRFIVDHAAGGWLDTEVQEINLFDVLSKTLPQLTDIQTLYQGYIGTSNPHKGELLLESATAPAMPYARITSDFIPLVNNHTTIKFYDVNDQTLPLTCRYYFYNESKVLVSAPGDWHSNQGNNGLIDIDVNYASEYVRVSIARINSKGQRSDSGILKPTDVCLTASTAIHDTRAASKLNLDTVTNQVNDLQSKVMRKCTVSFDYMAVSSSRYRPAMPDNPQSRLLSETIRLTGGTTFKINSNYQFIIWPWAEQDAVPYVNDLEYDSSKHYYRNIDNETWEEETLRLKYGSPITGQGIIFDNVNQKYIWGTKPERLANNANEYTVDEKYNGMLVRFVIGSAINSQSNIYPSDVVLLTDDPTISEGENCVIDSEIINLVGSGSEYGLNITQQGASNMMMSYPNAFYPMAIRYSKHENKNSLHDKLYWGFTTADGYSGVASYNFDNQETIKTLLKHGEPDDHNMCAIYIYPEDGTIIAGYTTGHNAGPYLHFRRSLMGEDISHFDKETRLKANGNTTYMQFIRYNPRKEYASMAEAAAAAVANGWIESADNIDTEGYQQITVNTTFYPEIIYYVLEGTTYKKVTQIREGNAIPDNNTTYYHNIWDYFPSDALYVFYRDGDTNWYYSKTQDKGITWSQIYPIVTNIASSASDFPKYYCKFQKTTTPGVIRIILFCNATEDKYSSLEYWDNQHLGSGYKYNHCRMGFLNLNDGTIHNANYFPDSQNYNKNDDQSLFKNEYRELISTDVEKLNNKFIPGICYYTNTGDTYKYVAWSTIMKKDEELYPNDNTYYTNIYTPNGGVNPLHFAIIRPKNMTGVFTKVSNITARKGMVYFEWDAENETNHVGTQLPQKTTLAANTDYGYWAFKTYLRVFDVKITDLHRVELLTGDMTGDTTTYYVDEIIINETDPLYTYESEETSVNAVLMTTSGPVINHYGDWTPTPITQEKLMVWVSKYPGGACWSNSSSNDYKFSIISNDATGVNSSQFVNADEYVSLYEYTPKDGETQPIVTKIKDIYSEKIDRWDYPNTSSALDPYIRQFRPVFDIDGTVLLWTRGIYNYRDFRYFNMDLMLYDIQNDKLLIDKGVTTNSEIYDTIQTVESEIYDTIQPVQSIIKEVVEKQKYYLLLKWENGSIDSEGNETYNTSYMRTAGTITCLPDTIYRVSASTANAIMRIYDEDGFIGSTSVSAGTTADINPSARGGTYFRIVSQNRDYDNVAIYTNPLEPIQRRIKNLQIGETGLISTIGNFNNGSVNSGSGAYASGNKYRVSTPLITHISSAYEITIATGFRVYMTYFVNSVRQSSGWIDSGTIIPADSDVRIMIARVEEDEDSSEVADVTTFVNAVTVTNKNSFPEVYDTIQAAREKTPAMVDYGVTWDWWITAHSTDPFGNAYIGYIDTDGYVGLLKRQPDGAMQYKRLETSYNNDDHNGLATFVLSDGRILAMGSHGHSHNNYIICWRSVKPYSIDEMEKLSFSIPQNGDYTYKTTYMQIFEYNGALFAFFRLISYLASDTSQHYGGFGCLISNNNGNTWTAYKALSGAGGYSGYQAITQATDDNKYLKMICAKNPADGNGNFVGCVFDLSTYKVYDLENQEIGEMVALDGGSMDDESLARAANMTVLTTQTSGDNIGRLFYAFPTEKANTVFCYAISNSAQTDFTYRLYNNGTITDLGHSGVSFGNSTYIGGACFGSTQNIVYYSKALDTAEGNYEIHKVKILNNVVDGDEIICTSSMCMIRPLYLASGELAVTVGHYNDTNPESLENWNHFTHWQMKPKFLQAR